MLIFLSLLINTYFIECLQSEENITSVRNVTILLDRDLKDITTLRIVCGRGVHDSVRFQKIYGVARSRRSLVLKQSHFQPHH